MFAFFEITGEVVCEVSVCVFDSSAICHLEIILMLSEFFNALVFLK